MFKTECRTCFNPHHSQMHELCHRVKRFHNKLLSELLEELTQINLNHENVTNLPQYLCTDCMDKLENAYNFVLQAKQVNMHWLQKIQSMPEAQYFVTNTTEAASFSQLRIKHEVVLPDEQTEDVAEINLKPREVDGIPSLSRNDQQDAVLHKDSTLVISKQSQTQSEIFNSLANENSTFTNSTERGEEFTLDASSRVSNGTSDSMEQHSTHLQFENNLSTGNNDELDDMPLKERRLLLRNQQLASNDPLATEQSDLDDNAHESTSINTSKLKSKEISAKEYKCNQCDRSYNWPASLNMHMRKHTAKSNWLTCPHCPRKFYRKDNMMAHMRKKHGAPKASKRSGSTLANITELDINLCLPHGVKRIQCMLCLQRFERITELRKHLKEHGSNVKEFKIATEALNELAGSFFANVNDIDKEKLKQRISNCLAVQNYDRFYSITNQAGRELCLDSSETESDFEEESKKSRKDERYACELCHSSYSRKYQLFDHQRQQHAWLDAPHVCTRCHARFVSSQLLTSHSIRQCHNMQKLYICKYCRARFHWRQNLSAHYATHRDKNSLVHCEQCNRSFRDARGLNSHNLSMHADKSKFLDCRWCSLKFSNQDFLLKHLQKRHALKEQHLPLAQTHLAASAEPTGKKNISCKVCELTFRQIRELRTHLENHANLQRSYNSSLNYSISNEKGFELCLDDSDTDDDTNSLEVKYTCSLCQVQCRRQYELQRHQLALHPYDAMPHSCSKCIFKCAAKRVLERHERSQCLNKEKLLSCTTCGYKFMWQENLELHQRLHNTFIDSLKPSVKTVHSSEKMLICPHCDRTYKQNTRLNNHIRDVHSQDGEPRKPKELRLFLCSKCGVNLRSRGELQLHMRRHNNDKPFHCDMCDMAFVSFFELKMHRRKHTGEKPYQCTVCQKNFARSDKLRVHQATHRDKKSKLQASK